LNDPTEAVRRQQVAEINADPSDRAVLETKYGQVWNSQELAQDFEVIGFMAPYVIVKRKSDDLKGSLQFQHSPRFYFNFVQ